MRFYENGFARVSVSLTRVLPARHKQLCGWCSSERSPVLLLFLLSLIHCCMRRVPLPRLRQQRRRASGACRSSWCRCAMAYTCRRWLLRGDQTQPLPILLTRTPYGVPTQEEFDKAAAKNGAEWLPTNWQELAADGYIFVCQNLRGRFKSEGVFLITDAIRPERPRSRPTRRTTHTTPSTGW